MGKRASCSLTFLLLAAALLRAILELFLLHVLPFSEVFNGLSGREPPPSSLLLALDATLWVAEDRVQLEAMLLEY